MQIKTDFHNHTSFSYCGKDNKGVYEIANSLNELGFTHMGVTDHYHYDVTYGQKMIDSHRAEVKDIRKNHKELDGLEIYIAAELEMTSPGRLSAPKEIIEQLDYVAVACTHAHIHTTTDPITHAYPVVAQYLYDFTLAGATHSDVNVIVHPLTMKDIGIPDFDIRKVTGYFTDEHYKLVIDLLHESNTAIELHAGLASQRYIDAAGRFLFLCKENGVKFTFGSDSHAIRTNGDILKAQEFIDQLGVTEDDLWFPSV